MPLIYTGAPDVIDELVQVYRGNVPGDVAAATRRLDEAEALAEMAALGEGNAMGLAREARLSTAAGAWLDQHLRDRGLWRAKGEDDASARIRARTAPAAVIYDAIYASVAAIVAAADPAAVWYLIRVPLDFGAFADVDCWCDADSRVTPIRQRMTIALIPASLGIRAAVLEALRSKIAMGRLYSVEEF